MTDQSIIASSPFGPDEHERIMDTLRTATGRNCVFLLKEDQPSPIHGPIRSKLITSVIRLLLTHAPAKTVEGRHGLVLISSQPEAVAVARVLHTDPELLGRCEVVLNEGHADLVSMRKNIQASWKAAERQVFVVSSNSLLFLFCMGLFSLENFDFICFDDLTRANRNHSYCTFMQSFFCPLLAQRYGEGGGFALTPRIVAFANWPRMTKNEAFHVKLQRDRKFFQYHRLFHSTIVPLKLNANAAFDDWMPDAYFNDLFPALSVFSGLNVSITKDLITTSKELLGSLEGGGSHATVFVEAGLVSHFRDYPVEDGYAAFDAGSVRKIVIIGRNPQMPLTDILTSSATSIAVLVDEGSLELVGELMAYRMGFLAMQAPHEAGKLIGSFESFQLNSTYLEPEGPVHWRVPQSNCLMVSSVGIELFLALCACLPKDPEIPAHTIRTVAVKRVSAGGDAIDQDQHYFMTHIKLPSILSLPPYSSIPAEELMVAGKLMRNRLLALNSAASAAIRVMCNYGVLDGNLMPKILADDAEQPFSLETALTKDLEAENDDVDADQASIPQEDVATVDAAEPPLEINEIIPREMRFSQEWLDIKAKSRTEDHKASEVAHFTMVVFEYCTGLQDQGKTAAAGCVPCDSRIHMEDIQYFSSAKSQRTVAILFPHNLNVDFREVCINLGSSLNIEGRLRCVRNIPLEHDDVQKLLEFQVFIFGAINPHSIVLNRPASTPATSALPDDKKLTFLAAMVKTQDAPILANPLDLRDSLGRYENFVAQPHLSLGKLLKTKGEGGEQEWSIDWELIDRALDQSSYGRLDKMADELEHYVGGHLTAPTFTTSPDKPPTVADFRLFALRRLITYAPHVGIFYRVKSWMGGLNPCSPFTSRTASQCTTYAEYYHLRYGIQVEDPYRNGLVQVKRVENFANISKWVSKDETQTRSRRSDAKSIAIPELTLVVPLPYAVLRLALLIPRLVRDVECQLLATQCLRDRFSVLAPLWPASGVVSEALTGTAAMAAYNYERLEILGDSILKLFTTVDVFLGQGNSNEGKLTQERQGKISNFNLLRLSNELGISQYARVTPFLAKLFSPPAIRSLLSMKEMAARWPFAPQLMDDGLLRWRGLVDLGTRADRRFTLHHLYPDGKLVVTDLKAQDAIQKRHRSVRGNLAATTKHGFPVPPKTLADIMESLIAAFYLGPGGLTGALEFLIFLGICSESMRSIRNLDPERIASAGGSMLRESPGGHNASLFLGVAQVNAAYIHPAPYIPDEVSFPYEAVEEILGYRFKRRRLLFQACTHVSVDISHSYERLEWLGDAALDWIVTRYYWEGFADHKWMTPRRITNARGAAVCNESYARIALATGVYRYLRISSQSLQLDIESFSQEYARNPFGLHGETQQAPKVLGDLFEALAGAIFLDLGFDMESFERIMIVLVRPFLQAHADPYDLPDQPLHDFWHSMRLSGLYTQVEFQFEPPEAILGQPSLCKVLIRKKCLAESLGPTRALAKVNACRLAAKYIQSDGWREFTGSRH